MAPTNPGTPVRAKSVSLRAGVVLLPHVRLRLGMSVLRTYLDPKG